MIRYQVAPLAKAALKAQSEYDLLLKGAHVIDPRNKLNAVRDVAIRDGGLTMSRISDHRDQ
jgi:dihydroorotase